MMVNGWTVVDVSGCAVTGEKSNVLVTFALGSCIALSVFDPAATVGGLLHFMLPDSALDSKKAAANPFMFADTGIATLLEKVGRLGARRERLIVRAAGGANVQQWPDTFAVGRRNQQAMLEILDRKRLALASADIGGSLVRTVWLEMATGSFRVRREGLSPAVTEHRT